MSQQAHTKFPGRDLRDALAGVIFCDFIGVLLFAVPGIGRVLGLGCMLAGTPFIAWMALEAHPKRGPLTAIIGVVNAVLVVVGAIALIAIALQSVQWG